MYYLQLARKMCQHLKTRTSDYYMLILMTIGFASPSSRRKAGGLFRAEAETGPVAIFLFGQRLAQFHAYAGHHFGSTGTRARQAQTGVQRRLSCHAAGVRTAGEDARLRQVHDILKARISYIPGSHPSSVLLQSGAERNGRRVHERGERAVQGLRIPVRSDWSTRRSCDDGDYPAPRE